MTLSLSRELSPVRVAHYCIDKPVNFRSVLKEMVELEPELLRLADVVSTGGHSLCEQKRGWPANLHPSPSSVDTQNFNGALIMATEPTDQADFSRPGLPAYLGGWDAAQMPFAINESTRFTSPTKTPEYLAGGRPVVSTPIVDVVPHYGELEAVKIAGDATRSIAACRDAVERPEGRLAAVDEALAALSWDETFQRMDTFVSKAVLAKRKPLEKPIPSRLSAPVARSSSRRAPFDHLVLGVGFAGSVLAERLAKGLDRRVLLIGKRRHIDPYYLILRQNDIQLYNNYDALAPDTPDVRLVRRLSTYRYHNMDHVIGQALATYRRISQKADRIVPVGDIGPTASGD